MSDATERAQGEIHLASLCESWAEHVKQQGLAWSAPKLAIEDRRAVARFHDYRVSVCFLGAEVERTLDWCTTEAEARWLPVVFYERDHAEFCAKLATALDRRIPW